MRREFVIVGPYLDGHFEVRDHRFPETAGIKLADAATSEEAHAWLRQKLALEARSPYEISIEAQQRRRKFKVI